jgi:hypothetical protein
MKKLNEDECRVMNTYFEYLDHLTDTKITQNTHFLEDGRADLVNLFIAACLTIKKMSEPKVEDPLA